MIMLRKLTFLVFISTSIFLTITTIHFVNNSNHAARIVRDIENLTVSDPILDVINCSDVTLVTSIKQRGEYYVFYNFVRARRNFRCHETITLTTPADFRFLDNVIPLVRRWQGPVSVALYAPGHDILDTLESIAYLRHCTIPEVQEFVTFHVFFELSHMYDKIIPLKDIYNDTYNCSFPAPYETVKEKEMYKTQNNLLYPINVARNIARETAATHFVFPSDIELYPTPNFIKKFKNFVVRNSSLFESGKGNIFVLPVFEIKQDAHIPRTKTELQTMLRNNTAFVFHNKVCRACHLVIKGYEWIRAKETKGLGVFSVGKRQGYHKIWEPFFISTNREPLFDERLSWEGQGNKMSQAYALCLLDYNFNVLDNAFLTHKPGIKKTKKQILSYSNVVRKMDRLLKNTIRQELINLYGDNPKCRIKY